MVYEIGAYVIDPGKDFTDVNEAVQYIQGLYPELDKETIKNNVKPFIVKPKQDVSAGAKKRIAESNKGNSENN